MKIHFLPAYFKNIGYISLIVAVSAYFIVTSGLLVYFQMWFYVGFGDLKEQWEPSFLIEPYFRQFPLGIFLFSIFLIGFSADTKVQASTTNRLLLPHYFKIVGYVFLAITLTLCVLIKTKKFSSGQSVTTKMEWQGLFDFYKSKMSEQQKKDYLKIEGKTKTAIQSTVEINSISLILPIGLLFLAFSKEKIEDELITTYRAQSLQLAILLLFFLILYQKFNVPEVETLIVTGNNSIGYFDLPGSTWKADVLINVILIFSIVRMEYLLRIKPLFNK